MEDNTREETPPPAPHILEAVDVVRFAAWCQHGVRNPADRHLDFDGAELRKLAANKVSLIKTMTRVELRRLAQIFIREVKVRKDGIDLVVRGDGFKKLMRKE